jgi:hypothetical protein
MLTRFATEKDLPAWYTLATEVSPTFRNPEDMAQDPEFIVMVTKIKKIIK